MPSHIDSQSDKIATAMLLPNSPAAVPVGKVVHVRRRAGVARDGRGSRHGYCRTAGAVSSAAAEATAAGRNGAGAAAAGAIVSDVTVKRDAGRALDHAAHRRRSSGPSRRRACSGATLA